MSNTGKIFIVLFIVLTSLSSVVAQQPVKVDFVAYFAKLIPPPANCKDVYAKADCNIPNHPGDCTVDSIFKPQTDELMQYQMEITAVSASQSDLAKKMQDPDFQKKMETMSDEEKMKMATEMQAQAMADMVPTAMVPEPPSVTAVFKSAGEMSDSLAKMGYIDNAFNDVWMKHQTAMQEHTKLLDEAELAEINKLPVIQSGEDSGPDPKAVKAVNLRKYNKKIEFENSELMKLAKVWESLRVKYVSLFKKFNDGLIKIHYGDDARNKMTKTMLGSNQARMIGELVSLISNSQNAWEEAVEVYNEKVQREKRE